MSNEDRESQYLWDVHSPYMMVRAKQLEGTTGDVGGWNTSAMRVVCGWGDVPVTVWRDENWIDPIEPPGIDELAKNERISFYRRVRNAQDCIDVLATGLTVKASFEISQQWHYAELGIIQAIPDDVVPHESHAVEIYAYIPEVDGFAFANTWGLKWGADGRGLLPKSYFDQWLIDAWVKHKLIREGPVPELNHGIYFENYFCPVLDKDYLGCTIVDTLRDEKIGWAFCVPRGGFFDFEEIYIKPQYRNLGYGTALALRMKSIADRDNFPIRIWVSFADSYGQNHKNVLKIASVLGLNVTKSDVSWAGYKGIPGNTPRRLPTIRIPARPRGPLDETATEEESPLQTVTDEMEEEMIARRVRRGRLAQMEDEEYS